MTNAALPDPDAERPQSADAWFARLRATPSAADRAAFERWRENPDNARAYDHLLRTWDQSKFLAHTSVGRTRDLARARRRARPEWGAIAAGVLLVLCLAGGLATLTGRGRLGEAPAATAIAADARSIRTAMLPDGSRATLDRGSAIRVAFTDGERRLQLVRGRARFAVAHDPARPFVVDAGDGSVIAHGTIFDVAFEGDDVQVVLLRGAVEVRRRSGPRPARADDARHLAPGQVLRFGRGPLPLPLPLPSPAAAAGLDLQWTSAMIAFDNVSLGDALAAFSRTSPRPVRLGGEAAAHRRLTGAFRRDDPEGFARTVAATFGLVPRDDPDRGITLTSDPPDPRKKTIG